MTQTPRTFSFEFFPPKTPEGVAKLRTTRQQLAQFKPQFFSVTFGAGGTTRDGTLSTVLEIHSEGQAAAPHLSCIGSTRENIAAILNEYRGNGIRHLVALRGDIPSGMVAAGEFRYANELVEFIRAEHGDHFHIEVAAYPEFHPQARSAEDDLANFVRKVRAGADSAMTQYFFNADSYFRFVDESARAGWTFPSCRVSCRSRISASCAASPTCAGRKCRAGCGCACSPITTTPRPSARWDWTW